MKIGPRWVTWVGIALLGPLLSITVVQPSEEKGKLDEVLPKGSSADPKEGMAQPRQPEEKQPFFENDQPLYKPPMRGAPIGRVAGGTRGNTNGVTFLSVLAPDHVGLSSRSQPCLYWFLSELTKYPIEFTLTKSRAVSPLVEAPIAPPRKAGIQCIRLADYDIHIEPGVEYRWFVAIIRDTDNRSKDLLAGAALSYREFPRELQGSLAQAGGDRAVHVYARAGFWYDALEAICKRVNALPYDRHLRRARASLLEQVGLHAVARWDVGLQ